nr:hypothetical protein BaRGS_031016 [Batillaria attramentaria]
MLGCTCLSHAARVSRVALLPLPEVSHCREMVSIGRELHARGHQVILLVPDYFKVRRCTEPAPTDTDDLEIRTFTTHADTAEKIGDHLESLPEEIAKGNTAVSVRDVMVDVCRSYIQGKKELDKLRRERASGHDADRRVPDGALPDTDPSLPGRVFRGGDVLGKRLYFVDYNNLIRKASLYLENSDHVVDYPKATFPNFVQVGGLTAAPARPLPGPLQRFFDGAEDKGVVVVYRNLQIASWFPQNDALGHLNTRLLVSHCGQKNSFFEALYHAVPVLCTPLHPETLGTAVRVAEFGVGQNLDLLISSAETITYTINSLLKDKSVRVGWNLLCRRMLP